MFRQRMQDADVYLRRAIELGEESANPTVIAYACHWLAGTCAHLGRLEEASALLERSQEAAINLEDRDLHFLLLSVKGIIYQIKGDAGITRNLGDRMLEYGERYSYPRSLVEGHIFNVFALGLAGDLEKALEKSQQAISVAKDPYQILYAQSVHGMYQVFNGSKPSDIFEDSVIRARNLGFDMFANWLGGALGLGWIIEGRMAEGIKLIEECSRKSLDYGHQLFHQVNEWFKGKIYLQLVIGEETPPLAVILKNLGFLIKHLPFAARRADTLLGNAARYFEGIGAYGWHAQALLDLGLLHKAKKRKAKAIACLEEAEPLFVKAGADVFLRQTRDLLAELH